MDSFFVFMANYVPAFIVEGMIDEDALEAKSSLMCSNMAGPR